MVVQPRDLELVRIVAQHRVIASPDIQLLVPGSDQTLLRRLQKLFHHGYLDRPRSQRQRGNAPMVYALGTKGAELLAREAGERPIDPSEKNRQLGAMYLEHALMVSRFQAALRFALTETRRATIERWLADGQLRDAVSVEHETGSERIPIAPDAVFTLRLLDEPEGRNRIHVFLEADRGSMTTKRFFVKMRGYWHYWRGGRQERFDIKNFLVLTVTRSVERAKSLNQVASELDAPECRGLRMFLFGPEANYAVDPLQILEAVWVTPGSRARHSVLE